MDSPGRNHCHGTGRGGPVRWGISSAVRPRSFDPSITLHDLSLRIKQKALDAGFDLAGIAPADPPSRSSFLDEWLSRGFAGDMAYLSRTAAIRKNLREKFPWARSLLCLAFRHPMDRPNEGLAKHIARYAQGDDYHEILDRPLEEVETYIRETSTRELGQAAQTWRYIDTGPVMEKSYAAAAGVGWIGKNTLVLNESHGSYLLLAEIITDLDLPPDPPAAERCGSCTRCLDACPTRAFVSPYVLDSTRCISYHTIESKKEIPEEVAGHLGENLFGCDICQEVCPWNRPDDAVNKAFETRDAYRTLSLEDIARISEEEFRTLFRKSPVKRPGWTKLRETARMISGPATGGARGEDKTRPE